MAILKKVRNEKGQWFEIGEMSQDGSGGGSSTR